MKASPSKDEVKRKYSKHFLFALKFYKMLSSFTSRTRLYENESNSTL